MTAAADLDRLCQLAGIEPSYRDVWGEPRHADPETLRTLLAAMGIAAETPDETAAAIRSLEEEEWRRPLPPVLVVRRRRGAAPAVPITLAAGAAEAPIEWQFEEEGGRAFGGNFRLEDLPLDARRTVGGVAHERRLFELPRRPPPGYHRFRLLPAPPHVAGGELVLIVAPTRCFLPAAWRGDGRLWGFAVQLYALRSERDWGMGDFGDLARLVDMAVRLGAGAIGLNPLHALFPGNPAAAGPYSPSSRQFLNVLYLDVEAIPDFRDCPEAQDLVRQPDFRDRLARLRRAELIDYVEVSDLKRPVLERLYRTFRERHLDAGAEDGGRGGAFRQFQQARGAPLRRLALFDALSEHFGGASGWRDWPDAYQDPASPEVAEFARAHETRVEFFEYLQWQADAQLAAAAAAAEAASMPLGLYQDMALAVDAGGADAWAQQDLYLGGLSIGAPPDEWNRKGQNWGLPPINPRALRARAYAPFAATVRANMRHGGALRIDHVMSLMRLFWIPAGRSASEGAYVNYPFEDLLGILALESNRQRCAVIGEDLGTLPEGFHGAMRRAGVLSYRLLYFQQDARGRFLPPRRYPRLAVVSVTTHDLATLPGFWAGRDIELRDELDLYPSRESAEAARADRAEMRRQLVAALKREGLIPAEGPDNPAALTPELVEAVYRFLAATPGLLLMVQPEDVLGEVEQVNLPGTTDEHPNWRRRLPLALESFADAPNVRRLVQSLRAVRPPVGGG